MRAAAHPPHPRDPETEHAFAAEARVHPPGPIAVAARSLRLAGGERSRAAPGKHENGGGTRGERGPMRHGVQCGRACAMTIFLLNC
jgi:hypothetical protein